MFPQGPAPSSSKVQVQGKGWSPAEVEATLLPVYARIDNTGKILQTPIIQLTKSHQKSSVNRMYNECTAERKERLAEKRAANTNRLRKMRRRTDPIAVKRREHANNKAEQDKKDDENPIGIDDLPASVGMIDIAGLNDSQPDQLLSKKTVSVILSEPVSPMTNPNTPPIATSPKSQNTSFHSLTASFRARIQDNRRRTRRLRLRSPSSMNNTATEGSQTEHDEADKASTSTTLHSTTSKDPPLKSLHTLSTFGYDPTRDEHLRGYWSRRKGRTRTGLPASGLFHIAQKHDKYKVAAATKTNKCKANHSDSKHNHKTSLQKSTCSSRISESKIEYNAYDTCASRLLHILDKSNEKRFHKVSQLRHTRLVHWENEQAQIAKEKAEQARLLSEKKVPRPMKQPQPNTQHVPKITDIEENSTTNAGGDDNESSVDRTTSMATSLTQTTATTVVTGSTSVSNPQQARRRRAGASGTMPKKKLRARSRGNRGKPAKRSSPSFRSQTTGSGTSSETEDYSATQTSGLSSAPTSPTSRACSSARSRASKSTAGSVSPASESPSQHSSFESSSSAHSSSSNYFSSSDSESTDD